MVSSKYPRRNQVVCQSHQTMIGGLKAATFMTMMLQPPWSVPASTKYWQVLHILQRIHQQLTWTSACLLHRNTWHFAAGPVPSNKNNTYLLLTIQLTVVRSLVLEVQTKFDGDQQEPLKLWCSIIQMVCVWCSLMFIVSSSIQDPWLVTSASVVLPEAHILSSPSYTPW